MQPCFTVFLQRGRENLTYANAGGKILFEGTLYFLFSATSAINNYCSRIVDSMVTITENYSLMKDKIFVDHRQLSRRSLANTEKGKNIAVFNILHYTIRTTK